MPIPQVCLVKINVPTPKCARQGGYFSALAGPIVPIEAGTFTKLPIPLVTDTSGRHRLWLLGLESGNPDCYKVFLLCTKDLTNANIGSKNSLSSNFSFHLINCLLSSYINLLLKQLVDLIQYHAIQHFPHLRHGSRSVRRCVSPSPLD